MEKYVNYVAYLAPKGAQKEHTQLISSTLSGSTFLTEDLPLKASTTKQAIEEAGKRAYEKNMVVISIDRITTETIYEAMPSSITTTKTYD